MVVKNRKTKRKIKKLLGGEIRNKIDITIPEEFSYDISELLWLDNSAVNIQLNLKYNSGLNNTLKEIMYQLGATEEVLKTKCFVICGATAVGKTKFINNIKIKFNAEVINMDTMQVYDMISVGTGRANLANTKGSYLYGIYNPNKKFHILNYLDDMFKAVKIIKKHGNPIIFEGASKSLLEVIRRIFPNIFIFGIQAVDKENIISNITKRIDDNFIKNAILELSISIKENKISFNSEILRNNPEVYTLIIAKFKEDQLKEDKLNEKLDTIYSDIVKDLVKEVVNMNIKLHLLQYNNLQKIPDIQWFNNNDASIELLEKSFNEKLSMPDKDILIPTNDFNFIDTNSCSSFIKHPSEEICRDLDIAFNNASKPFAIEYSAKLNIPLLPLKGSKQIVLGSTKYLLPYCILPEYFNTFAIKPEEWTLEKNMYLIECITSKFIDNNIIRIVTTPRELVDENRNYRITSKEICIFKSYSYNFYKYNSDEFPNIYFASILPLTGCSIVDVSQGAFRCNGEKLGNYLYF